MKFFDFCTKVRSSYCLLAYFSDIFISGKNVVISTDRSYILKTRDDRVEANQSTACRGLAALKVCRGFTKKSILRCTKGKKISE